MKVNMKFEFDEAQLRSIRAAQDRGGVASRKDSQLFINEAVQAALRAAPTPKAARVRKPEPEPVIDATVIESGNEAQPGELQRTYKALGVGVPRSFEPSGDESVEAAVEQRERIKGYYDV